VISSGGDCPRKDSSDGAELLICCSTHRELRSDVFMTRLDDLSMEKKACGDFRDREIWGAISVTGDARTGMRDPKIGEILSKGD
jgi:hypothetical protein